MARKHNYRGRRKWKTFLIDAPDELIPIYNLLQEKLDSFIKDDKFREAIETKIDWDVPASYIQTALIRLFPDPFKEWSISNPAWHARIVAENIRRIHESNRQRTIAWEELVKNNYKINSKLKDTLKAQNIFLSEFALRNLKRANRPPEFPRNITLCLDYSIVCRDICYRDPEHNNTFFLRLPSGDWFRYEISFPASISWRLTGEVAKPKFVKTQETGELIGYCSYEYFPLEPTGNNILGVDLGRVKAFSAVVYDPNHNIISQEYKNSKQIDKNIEKLKSLYQEKNMLHNRQKAYEKLGITDNPHYKNRQEQIDNIANKIVRTKKHIAKLASYELCELARETDSGAIYIENLRWLEGRGGTWNFRETQQAIYEKAEEYGLEVVEVNPAYSSQDHPITGERGKIRGRNVVFSNGEVWDRDNLAAVNLSLRKNPKKKKKKQEQPRTKKKKPRIKRTKKPTSVKTKSRRKHKKQTIEENTPKKGRSEAVLLLPDVAFSRETGEPCFELVVWPLSKVQSRKRPYRKVRYGPVRGALEGGHCPICPSPNQLYAELNTKSDYCQCCGYSGEISIVEDENKKLIWKCPNCGNVDWEKMNITRRVCGYLSVNDFNQGRTQEIKERVLHL